MRLWLDIEAQRYDARLQAAGLALAPELPLTGDVFLGSYAWRGGESSVFESRDIKSRLPSATVSHPPISFCAGEPLGKAKRQSYTRANISFLPLVFEYWAAHNSRIIMSDAARWKATVYVGGLAPQVTTSHVMDAFIPFGEIVEVKLPKPDAPNSTEAHKGFAYVEFDDAADAKEAIDNMDQAEFFGRTVRVSQAKAPKSAQEGLGSKTAVWEQVCIYFLQFNLCYARSC